MPTLFNDIVYLLPEIGLAVYAMVSLLYAVYSKQNTIGDRLLWVTALVFVGAAIAVIAINGIPNNVSSTNMDSIFRGMLATDALATFSKVLILLTSAVVLVIGHSYLQQSDLLRFEYPPLLTLAVVGMLIMVSARDLIAFYMGIELQSLALYIIAALHRDNVRSTEAGLKYFVLGALSSGFLLYGASLAYGYSGTTLFSGLIAAGQTSFPIGLIVALAFLCAGMAFKISAAPFHMWTPDVYQGAPTPITAFFATAPKIAAMVLFARLIFEAFGAAAEQWQQIVAVLSVLSMFVGALAAIGQTDIKRLLAYSSISHMGFACMGLASNTIEGIQATLIYMLVYVVMNTGVFAFIIAMRDDHDHPIAKLKAFHLLAKSTPVHALILLVLLCSLAGLPPFLGFFAKIYVLKAAIDSGLIWLAIAGVIASVIGAFYYLRIIYYMYFGQEQNEHVRFSMPSIQWLVMVFSAVFLTLGIINMFGLEQLTLIAASSIAP